MKTYKIPEQNYQGFERKIQSLSKRAVKLGCSPITVQKLGEEIKRYSVITESGVSRTKVVRLIEVKIDGQSPMLEGWTFLGVINHLQEDLGNIVKAVPGFSIPEKYREAEPNCDHCQIKRYRVDTYIVKHENGDIKQIGSTCLRDFLGHPNIERVASYAELLASIEDFAKLAEDENFEYRGKRHYILCDLLEYLTSVATTIRLYGWLSKAKAQAEGGIPTAHKAEETRSKVAPTEEDIKLAQDALEWVREWVKQSNLNDYQYNLSVITKSDVLDTRTLGLAASIIPVYKRETTKKKESKSEKESQHFGTVGKREIFTLKLLGVVSIEGTYGVTDIHRFEDENGNRAVWFSSRGSEMDDGKTYKVQATVKKHGDYKGRKQTILTRCKKLEEVSK